MWNHSKADSNCFSVSSTSATNSSDYEGSIGDDISGDYFEPFIGIQPWHFEPPLRNSTAQEVEENIELPPAAVISIARNGESFEVLTVHSCL